MNITALRLPGKKAIPLHEWQATLKTDLREEYNEAVEIMHSADRALREASEEIKRFSIEKDSAERNMVFYTDTEGKKKRVKFSAPKDFRQTVLHPRSKAFQSSMAEVRRLHFACRNANIDVPIEVFRFLDSWGMIERRGTKSTKTKKK